MPLSTLSPPGRGWSYNSARSVQAAEEASRLCHGREWCISGSTQKPTPLGRPLAPAAMYLTGRLDIVVDAVSSAAWGTYAAVESPAKPDVVLEQALTAARPGGRPPSVLRVLACRATESSVATRYAIERWSPSQRESIASTDEHRHHVYSRSEQLHCSPVDIFQLRARIGLTRHAAEWRRLRTPRCG